MIFRQPEEADFAAVQALELELLRSEEARFDDLPDRERQARVRSGLASLLFFARSGHSFVAAQPGTDGPTVLGYVLALAIWEGDRASVKISSLRAHPDAPPATLQGLLHAVVKSAYDSGSYEVHLDADAQATRAAQAEGFRQANTRPMVRVMGSRSEKEVRPR